MKADTKTTASPSSKDATPALLLQLAPIRGVLCAIEADGLLLVRGDVDHRILKCDWLERADHSALTVGDAVLVALVGGSDSGVVLGRIGRYAPPATPSRVAIEATESLTLKCGEASVELRADGRAMVKGEDVLLRAKGTQRIRAGNVAIN